eukprot:15356918-Ditylum_brightwellii.AAC.1
MMHYLLPCPNHDTPSFQSSSTPSILSVGTAQNASFLVMNLPHLPHAYPVYLPPFPPTTKDAL